MILPKRKREVIVKNVVFKSRNLMTEELKVFWLAG